MLFTNDKRFESLTRKVKFIATGCLLISLLASCGGGGGGGASSNGTANGPANGPSGGVPTSPMPAETPTAPQTLRALTDGAWSNPAIWGNVMPKTGDKVLIPEGVRVELDTSPPQLTELIVEGGMIVPQNAQVTLTTNYIMVMGPNALFQAGTPAARFNGKLHIILSGTDTTVNVMGHGAKVLMVMDGATLSLHGNTKRSYTRVNASVQTGDRVLQLADDPTGWNVGDEIAIAPTDFSALQAERRRIVAVDGRRITLDAALSYGHWGEAAQTIGAQVLDMRAHVGNLSRNIRLSSADNQDRLLPGFDPQSRSATGRQDGAGKRPTIGRFGGHMTIMSGSYAQLDSIEITEFGQQGVLARYPLHWHLNGDTSQQGNYFRNSSLHQTFQRGVVIHQANGIEIENNVLFDIAGHGVYLEDGIERDNVIDRNLIMLIRYVPRKYRLSILDTEKDRAEKLSGMWITNPANLIRDNVVAGVQNGWGYIFAGVLEDKIPVIPRSDLNWVDNRGYSGFTGNTAYAIGFMQAVPDGGDSVFNLGYGPEEAGSCFRFNFSGDVSKSTPIQGLTAFKCANAASWSTNFLPIRGAVFADSRVAIVNNQGEAGISQLKDSVVVGMTANNPATRSNLTFGPFPGPVLKEHLESAPVTFNNVTAAGNFLAHLEGMAPDIAARASATAGFKLQLPSYVAVKANGSVEVPISVDRSGGYTGPIELSIGIPKPPNLAEENPYFPLTSTAVTVAAGATSGTLVLNLGVAARPASGDVAVIKAVGDSTVLNTLRVLTSTPAANGGTGASPGANLARLIPGDTPRNPIMSSVLRNAGGRFAIDGLQTTYAAFESNTKPWIGLDLERSYALTSIKIDWDASLRPSGPLVFSLSEFGLLNNLTSVEQALALPSSQAIHINIPAGSTSIEIPLPAGTVARQIKLWVLQNQTGEVRLQEFTVTAR